MGEAKPVTVRISQAVAMLGIGRSTLYVHIAAGEIETIKLGRSTLILVESLHAFIEGKRGSASKGSLAR